MTQTIAATDLIRRSMYLINALAAGEIPNTADLNDALLTLNEMIDSLNLQQLAIYGSATQNFILTPGQSTYNWGTTAGATGITTERPAFLNNVTCTRNGVTTPVEIITQQEFDEITLKSTSQALIERVVYINSFPLGILMCFPVPTEAVILGLDVARLLAAPITLQSLITLPPGYLRMLRYNLAVELWPEYTNPSTDIESVKKIAKESLGKVKVANIDTSRATFDDIPGVNAGRFWDWRTG